MENLNKECKCGRHSWAQMDLPLWPDILDEFTDQASLEIRREVDRQILAAIRESLR